MLGSKIKKLVADKPRLMLFVGAAVFIVNVMVSSLNNSGEDTLRYLAIMAASIIAMLVGIIKISAKHSGGTRTKCIVWLILKTAAAIAIIITVVFAAVL